MSRRSTFPVLVARGSCALLAAALLAACSSSGEPSGGSATAARGEPAGGSPFWVDPESDAARQVRQYEQQGRTEDAAALKRISERPVADWPAGDDPAPEISRAAGAAAKSGHTLVLVAYNIIHRDCGSYSAGGAHDEAYYQGWVEKFAGAIGDAPALVVLEPDAVPHMVDGCTPAEYHEQRSRLLSGAIDRLKKQPRTKVYLDAGNPAWIPDPGKLVEPLKRSGLDRADGFSLNVSNFQRDPDVRAYGAKLSALLGGAHYTMDTSRNGDGPLPGDRQEAWCNPPGRALGTPPTTRTGDGLIDAILWIKRPGDSDGTCRGGPAAGTWWPDYALGLAKRAGS
ncbi:glycoside hydrolase family 6 protein [Streptomyces sp. NPDC001941]|uniref:glycoside hydrolase family 6 protein n=1 Tax=Streptomyces sp. NPDC001941 TaxID=3154659 RepID=UPI003330D987